MGPDRGKILKFLTDENIFPSTVAILRGFAADVKDVKEAGLQGTSDIELIKIAHFEERTLLTLDMHFSNILVFPPALFSGIMIIRVKPTVPKNVNNAVSSFFKTRKHEELSGKLIIIEKEKYRIWKE